LFVKTVGYQPDATYPDYGSNTETYTAGSFMEIETLAPLQLLEPGHAAEHVERWHLYDGVDIGATESSLDAAIRPRVTDITKP
jgi:hypothetical protein